MLYAQARSDSEKWCACIALTLFLGKTLYEILTQSTLFVSSMGDNIVAMPLAHLAGGAIGTTIVLYLNTTSRIINYNPQTISS